MKVLTVFARNDRRSFSGGATFEAIPEQLILEAALLAASELLDPPPASSACT